MTVLFMNEGLAAVAFNFHIEIPLLFTHGRCTVQSCCSSCLCAPPPNLLAAALSAKAQSSVGGEFVDGGVDGDEEGEARLHG
jgi:hypothetical protein